MAEMTITQQLRSAEAGLAAAIRAREAAELVAEAADERRVRAEKAAPEAVGAGGYGDAEAWRQAHDEVGFAYHLAQKSGEALAAAQAAETDALGRLRAAERRNLIATRRAALEKLGRTGADLVRQVDRLWDLNRQISGRDGTRQTIGLVVKFIAVLGHQLKMGGLKAKGIHTDFGGRDWAGFVAWGESLLRGGSVSDGRVSERMAMADALDQLPDPVEDSDADAVEMIPASDRASYRSGLPDPRADVKPAIGLTNGAASKTDYSDIGPEEPP
jgi:hypothetical protein